MAIQTGQIAAGTNAALALSSLVLVTPTTTTPSATKGYQPLNAPTQAGQNTSQALPPALLFHYEGENSVTCESDITDHYVEQNYAVQDQIALRPEIVSTSGFIGELNDVVPAALQFLQAIPQTLTAIGAYAPGLSSTAQLAYNKAVLAYQFANNAASTAISAWSSISGGTGSGTEIGNGSGVFEAGANIIQNKQQQMFNAFYGYWFNRNLFNVQTPWAIFTNMAIKSLKPIQDADTRMITNFEVTFKKIRVATTQTTSASLTSTTQQDGRAAAQNAIPINQGTSSGTPGFDLATFVKSALV